MPSRTRWGWPWWLGALVLLAAAFYTGHVAIVASSTLLPPDVPPPYNQVRAGMTYEQVRASLGSPDRIWSRWPGPTCTWLAENHVLTVEFDKGRACSASWEPILELSVDEVSGLTDVDSGDALR